MLKKNNSRRKAHRISPSAVLRVTAAAAGVLLIADAAAMAFIVNFNAGIIFTALLGAVLAGIGAFFNRIKKIKWLSACFAAAFLMLAALLTFITVYGQNDTADYREEAVIVLGAGLRGEQVSSQLARRLDAAVSYCGKNPEAVVVVSGGQGADEDITEALAMERYLTEMGIPASRIIREEASDSTHTNLANSKAILDEKLSGAYRVTVITSNYHIYRASMTAQALGLDCTHVHSGIAWYSIPVSFLRECAAVIRLWLLGA